MKKLFSLAVVVAAMFCTSSCEGLIDAFLNNYFVGDECVLVGNAEMDYNVLSAYGFRACAKDENSKDEFQILMTKEMYEQAMTGEGFSDVKNLLVYGTAKEETVKMTVGLPVIMIGSELEKVYDTKNPVDYTGNLKISKKSSGYMTVVFKSTLTLKEIKNPEAKKDFVLSLNYHGTPEVKNAPEK